MKIFDKTAAGYFESLYADLLLPIQERYWAETNRIDLVATAAQKFSNRVNGNIRFTKESIALRVKAYIETCRKVNRCPDDDDYREFCDELITMVELRATNIVRIYDDPLGPLQVLTKEQALERLTLELRQDVGLKLTPLRHFINDCRLSAAQITKHPHEQTNTYRNLTSQTTMANPAYRDQVFISYSHKDKKKLEQLQTHLKPLVRGRKISVWDDTKIKSGDEWREEIRKAMASAKVALLLVSPDFLASDFIAEHELPPLLDAAQNEGLRILWVAVRHSSYEETEIERYQCINDPARPLASISSASREKELVRICKEIKAAALEQPSERQEASSLNIQSEESSPIENENGDDDGEEKGGADYAVDIEEAFEVMNQFVAEMTHLQTEFTPKIAGYAEQLQKLKENPPPGAARKRLGILTQAASVMNQWSKRIEQEAPSFEESVETLNKSFPYFIDFIVEPDNDKDRLAIANSRKLFSDFIPQTRMGTESFRELQVTVEGLRGLSKDVNRASRRLTEVLGSVIQSLERANAFGVRAISLIDDKFETDGAQPGALEALKERAVMSPRDTITEEWDKVEAAIIQAATRHGLINAGEWEDYGLLINKLRDAGGISEETREKFYTLNKVHYSVAFNSLYTPEPGRAVAFAIDAQELLEAISKITRAKFPAWHDAKN